MPSSWRESCNKCEFSAEGWDGDMYVADDNGNKILTSHSVDENEISQVLGIEKEMAIEWLCGRGEQLPPQIYELLEARVGVLCTCICIDCLHQFIMDVNKETRKCPQCGGTEVKMLAELKNSPCPKCKVGIMNPSEYLMTT